MDSAVITRARSRAAVSLLVLVALVASACGGGGGDEAAAPRKKPAAAVKDESREPALAGIRDELPNDDLELASDVVIVRSDRGRAVRAFGVDGDKLVLDADAEGLDELDEGEVLLLTGVTVTRVASIERDGDEVTIVGEPVTLPEVIVNGEFSWDDVTVDAQNVVLVSWGEEQAPTREPTRDGELTDEETEEIWDDVNDVLGGEDEQSLRTVDLTGARSANYARAAQGEPVTFKGKVGREGDEIEYEFTYAPEGPRPTVRMQLGFGDDLKGTLDVNVALQKLTTSGDAKVVDGKVQGFEAAFAELGGEVTVEANVQALSNVASAVTKPFLDLPFRFEVPLMLGGLPFTFSGESTIQVNLSMALAGSQLGGKAHFEFGGPAGFRVKDGALSVFGERIADVTNLLDSVKAAAKGPVGLVYTTELPKLGLGFGYGRIASAKAFISNGAVASFHVLPPPVPCTATNVAHVIAAGIDATFLGVDLELNRTAIANKQWNFQAPQGTRCNAPR